MLPTCVAAVVVVLALSPAPAQARISAAKDMAPSGQVVQDSDLAAGGARSALLMSTLRQSAPVGKRRRLYARLGHGASFGGFQRLATLPTTSDVAVGADGTAVAAWTASTSNGVDLLVAVANPGKAFGTAQVLLSRVRTRQPGLAGVAVTPTGRALVAWTRGTRVQVAIRAPRHRFASPVTLGRSRQYAPVATASPDGTLAVAWLDTPSGPPPPPAPYVPTPARMLGATLAPKASAFSPPAELGTLGMWITGPEAASGPGGAAVIFRWTFGEKRVVPVAAGGGFGAPEPLGVPFPGAGEGQPDALALGIPSSGPVMALWHDVKGIGGDVLRVTSSVVDASRRPPGGTFQTAAAVSRSGWLAGQPRAAATADRIVAAWAEARSGSTPRVCINVSTATRVGAESLCQLAPSVEENSVDAAAGSTFGLVSWIQGRAPRGGKLVLASYRK